MLLVPSLSIIDGNTARITQGDFSKRKDYKDSPLDFAKKFEDHGISRIHLIDLDGARGGHPVNYDTLQLIANYTKLKINFAGGIHTDGDVIKSFEYGAKSITAASIAVSNRELFSNWLMSYGRNKVALAADSLEGNIRIRGWQKATTTDLHDHISYFYDRGLKFLKTTDISKEGALAGPSFDLYKQLIKEFPNLSIFASGGVRNMEDIKKLRDIGIYGVVFGKAFYEGKISLDDIDSFQTIVA